MLFLKSYVYHHLDSGIATSLACRSSISCLSHQFFQVYWMLQLELCWGILSRLLWTLGELVMSQSHEHVSVGYAVACCGTGGVLFFMHIWNVHPRRSSACWSLWPFCRSIAQCKSGGDNEVMTVGRSSWKGETIGKCFCPGSWNQVSSFEFRQMC